MPLLGAVVLAIQMTELGKNTGPVIYARFKICPNGTTDWVPIVLGARSIDCVERGGLGHSPLDKSHAMAKLGIQMERVEQPYDRVKGSCYGCVLPWLTTPSLLKPIGVLVLRQNLRRGWFPLETMDMSVSSSRVEQ